MSVRVLPPHGDRANHVGPSTRGMPGAFETRVWLALSPLSVEVTKQFDREPVATSFRSVARAQASFVTAFRLGRANAKTRVCPISPSPMTCWQIPVLATGAGMARRNVLWVVLWPSDRRWASAPNGEAGIGMLIVAATSMFRPFGWTESLNVIRETGIRFVELSLRCDEELARDEGVNADLPDTATIESWQRQLTVSELGVAAVDISSGDMRDSSVEAVYREKLEMAAGFGASVAILDAGGNAEEPPPPHVIDRLRRLGDHAQSVGITLGLDTRPGYGGDTRSMMRTIETVHHPSVRIHFDTGTFQLYNPGKQGEIALQRVLPWLSSVGLKDYSGTPREESPELGCGGEIDFARTLEILRAVRFRRPCIIDRGRVGDLTKGDLAERRKWLIESVDFLRSCGWFDA